ncbi:MAG: amidase domain-containing protein [Propionicimonas sp.]
MSVDNIAAAFEALNRAVLVESSSKAAAVSQAKSALSRTQSRASVDPILGVEASRLKAIAQAIDGEVDVVDIDVKVSSTEEHQGVTVVELHVTRSLSDGVAWEAIEPVAVVDQATGSLQPGQVYSLDWELINEGQVPEDLTSLLNLEPAQAFQDTTALESETVGGGSEDAEPATPPGSGGGGVTPMALPSSGKTKVKDYALKYALSYNKDYIKYSADCTNFVSQAMLAGGWKEENYYLWNDDRAWWYGGVPTNSHTWSGAENWYKFARVHSKRTTHLAAVDSTVVGDVVQFKDKGETNMTHSMVVTKKSGSTTYVSGHTPDVKNAPASSYNKSGRTWYPHRT